MTFLRMNKREKKGATPNSGVLVGTMKLSNMQRYRIWKAKKRKQEKQS